MKIEISTLAYTNLVYYVQELSISGRAKQWANYKQSYNFLFQIWYQNHRYKTKKSNSEKGPLNSNLLSSMPNAFSTTSASTAFSSRPFRMPIQMLVRDGKPCPTASDFTPSSYASAAAAVAFSNGSGSYLGAPTGYLNSGGYIPNAPPTTTYMPNAWW